MASYNELNALIDAYIYKNGVQAITGQILNGVLKAMVQQIGRGYAIMGVADPTTDPWTPDAPESWFAYEPGTYTLFDGITVSPGEFVLLEYRPNIGWRKETLYDGFQTVDATIDGNVGTPSVGVSYANGVLSFDFHNMKGNPGEPGGDGDPAGFGTIGADITGGVGTPGVSVESSGPATAKNLQFHFTNLKGETGVTSVVVTVDNTTGTPTCTASLSGGVLTLAFTGLKGAQGNPGSSVDYPFTLVNNLTTDDPDQALSAAQGVVLQGEITKLEHEVDEFAPALQMTEKKVTKSITDYKFVGGSTLADNNFYAVIHTNTQPNREKAGILKYITLTVAPVSDTPFSIKLYRKVWENGVITSFTEIADSLRSLTFPAGEKIFDVSSENIVIDADVIIGVCKLAQYKSSTSHNNYVVVNGAYYPNYQGKWTMNIDYIVEFSDAFSGTLAGIEADNSGLLSVLGISKETTQSSIIDYTPAGSTELSIGTYWACLYSKTLADRERAGILKIVKLLTAPSDDMSISIKLYKKVWTGGEITGFTEVANSEYSFIFPGGATEFDISSLGIVIDKDVIIGINAPINYISNTSYKNYCITDGAFFATFEKKFSLEVDYIVEFSDYDSTRLDDIEDAIGAGGLDANVVLLGDSITWMGGDDCNGRSGLEGRGWSQYFKEIVKPTSIRSYARSGACWSHTENTVYDIAEDTGSTSDDNVIYNQINRLLADTGNPSPDIIIILAGTNDAWYPSARPDAVSVSADTEFADTEGYITGQAVGTLTSIAAAMRYDVEMLKTNYPNAQIIVTTPLQSTKFSLSRCFQVGKIISDCAGYLSVCCIDQARGGGIYRAQESEAFLFTADGAHPSVIGAKMVGQFLAKMVMDLVRGTLS